MDKQKTAQCIYLLRKEKNMTQKELAERIHVTDKAVSKWERGLGSPDISILPLLADALGVTADDILNGGCVSRLNNENTAAINTNSGVGMEHNGRFANVRNFLKMRHARIFFLIPIFWTCLFGVMGILYWYADLTDKIPDGVPAPNGSAVFLDLLVPWFIMSAFTGFIPLILCYVWHRLGTGKKVKN